MWFRQVADGLANSLPRILDIHLLNYYQRIHNADHNVEYVLDYGRIKRTGMHHLIAGSLPLYPPIKLTDFQISFKRQGHLKYSVKARSMVFFRRILKKLLNFKIFFFFKIYRLWETPRKITKLQAYRNFIC